MVISCPVLMIDFSINANHSILSPQAPFAQTVLKTPGGPSSNLVYIIFGTASTTLVTA